jgi:transcriptional regulator with XRE-family HTH domain
MADTNLKIALQKAGLTAEEFAEIVRVDPKTVQRWVAGTTVPYPRHRATIARALDLSEHELWPDRAPAPTARPDQADPDQVGSEVTGSWAHGTDEGAPDPVAFLSGTDGPIEFLENFRGIRLSAELARSLAEHAAAGRRIRVLTNLPTHRLDPLLGHENVEIRYVEYLDHTLLRAGDAMLVTLTVPYEADQSPPLLQLHRILEGGLFDRLIANLETIADNAEGPLTAPEQLERYLSSHDEEDEEDHEAWSEPPQPGCTPVGEQSGSAGSAETRTSPGREEQTLRRWPRRPA